MGWANPFGKSKDYEEHGIMGLSPRLMRRKAGRQARKGIAEVQRNQRRGSGKGATSSVVESDSKTDIEDILLTAGVFALWLGAMFLIGLVIS